MLICNINTFFFRNKNFSRIFNALFLQRRKILVYSCKKTMFSYKLQVSIVYNSGCFFCRFLYRMDAFLIINYLLFYAFWYVSEFVLLTS
jgi:hypothetical protein